MSGPAPTPDWQDALAAAVADPAVPPPAGLATPASGSLEARLAIYRNNALVPLVQALEESFPACRRLLGGSLLRRLLLRFVRGHPPASPVLQDYGTGLPALLAQAPECRDYPAAADLAGLELAVTAAWHAADAPLLEAADFASLLTEPERLAGVRFRWHPAAAVLASAFPVGSLWLAAVNPGQGSAPAGAGSAAGTCATPGRERTAAPDPPEQGQAVLVTRSDWAVHVRVLDPGQTAWLTALRAGQPLQDALAAALERCPQADPAALLALLVEGGFASATEPSHRSALA